MARARRIDLDDEHVLEQEPVTETPLSSAVAHAADLVRSIYINCRRRYTKSSNYGSGRIERWDGGTDSFGTTRQPIWPSVAVHLLELGAHPMEYIEAQFTDRGNRHVPQPNQLRSEKCVSRWRSVNSNTDSILFGLQADQTKISSEVFPLTHTLKWDYPRALRYVLLNEKMIPASPLYRYCLAEKEGLADIAARFHDRALVQYAFQSTQHDQIWGDFIPEVLRTEAAELRSVTSFA